MQWCCAVACAANFSFSRLLETHNHQLADVIGNLASRTMAKAFFPSEDGVANLPLCPTSFHHLNSKLTEEDTRFIHELIELPTIVHEQYDNCDYAKVVTSCLTVMHSANSYFSTNAPWKLVKKEKKSVIVQPGDPERLGVILYNCLEALRLVGLLLQPIMPQASHRLLSRLGVKDDCRSINFIKYGIRPNGDVLGNLNVRTLTT